MLGKAGYIVMPNDPGNRGSVPGIAVFVVWVAQVQDNDFLMFYIT